MRTDLKAICVLLAFLLLALVLSIMCGCQEQQIWGTGELPADWAGYFGTGNDSRINYVLAQRFNYLSQQITALAQENAAQHKIMAQSDIDLYARVKKLESSESDEIMLEFDNLSEGTIWPKWSFSDSND